MSLFLIVGSIHKRLTEIRIIVVFAGWFLFNLDPYALASEILIPDDFSGVIERVDKDNDGVAETELLKKNGQILWERSDRNGDGKWDDISEYSGSVRRRRLRDVDYDGYFEYEYTYSKKGSLKRRTVDKNKDGLPDYSVYFIRGRHVVLKEFDRNADGKVDRRYLAIWEMDRRQNRMRHQPVWIEEDNDFDGIIDRYHSREGKESDKQFVGKPIDTQMRAVDEEESMRSRGAKAASVWNIEEMVRQRQELESEER